jgi:transcriptional regulator with XRE-family HTH domain
MERLRRISASKAVQSFLWGMTASLQGQPRFRALLRRTRELNARIGRQVVELREEAGVTQAQLARCVGMAQSHLWKIEAGEAQPSLRVLLAIGSCLGADLGVRYFPGLGPRIHDRFQAPIVESLLRVLHDDWRAQLEVAVPAARGVLDLVLRRPTDGIVVACECHSETRRLEVVLRRLGEKAAALPGQLEGEPIVSRLLLLRSTNSTRSIARAYEATFATTFPARASAAVAALKNGEAWPGPGIVWARVEGGRAEILDAPPRGVRLGR